MRAFVILCLLTLASIPARAEPDYRGIALAAVDAVIVPGYRHFRDRSGDLDREAASFCAAPSSAGLDGLRGRFHATMDAWQRVQVIGFGPVEEFHRGQRVHFWPDKKNAGDRQMRQLLKERKAEVLEGPRVAFASVAIQGLPALEALLFDDGERLVAGEDAAFRCRVVAAIATNLAGIGDELVRAWTDSDGFRTRIADAGGPDSPYVDHRQAASQVFNALHGHLEAIAEVKLAHPMGDGVETARRQRAESWRSRRSLRNLVLNLEAVRAVARAAFAPALPESVAGSLTDALDAALAGAARVDGPMEAALERPEGWRALAEVKAKVKSVARVLEAQAGSALGMQVGFNALDGD